MVQSTILGLHLESLRIYGADRVVNYSINQMELGRTDITPASMERVMSSGIPFFETLSSVNMLSAMFMLKIPDGSYSLRTMFPLTVDLGISESTGKPESLVTGVLEITQDITDDYDSVVRFHPRHMPWFVHHPVRHPPVLHHQGGTDPCRAHEPQPQA